MRRIVFLLLIPVSGLAQQPRTVTLRPADAKLDEEFTAIVSVRELSDGRVLVSDPRDKGVVVVDFAKQSIETIGRKGSGPGEYQQAAPIFALSGDSSLMVDAGTRRWLLFDGARIAGTVPADAPSVLATQGLVTGVDRLGYMLTRGGMTAFSGNRDIGKADSGRIIRVHRGTAARDTVALVRMAAAQMVGATNAKGELTSMSIRRSPFSVGEDGFLFSDGYLAMVRMEPFRVDWRAPNGTWVRGPALPIPAIRMTDREKRAYMERTAEASGQPAQSPDTRSDWPDVIPAYAPAMGGRAGSTATVLTAPDGRLLVMRFRSADFPDTRYFVINRRGTMDAELRMPATERIVGFGAKSVYVAASDDDGIQRLQRHPWPW